MSFLDTCTSDMASRRILAELVGIELKPSISYQLEAWLISRYGFERPANTLPTRFPTALGIGHDPACGLANACALVYVAA